MNKTILDEMYSIPCEIDELIYFPLYRIAFKANPEAISLLKKRIIDEVDIDSIDKIDNIINKLSSITPRKLSIDGKEKLELNNANLIILPNHKCNFNCSYCYSAKGHSNEEISPNQLKAGINHLIETAKKNNLTHVSISFLGGGEPLLSWYLITWSYDYACALLEQSNMKISYSITTNGSLLDLTKLEWIEKNSIRLNISFDILPDIQNMQRGQFDTVSANIKKIEKYNIDFSIRSTITCNNIHRMEEMVKVAHNEYPRLKKIHFEPVSDTLDSPNFYSDFIKYFFRAKQEAEKCNIELVCSILKSFYSIKKRFCGGEFCLTPNGDLSICHRISSKKDDNFEFFRYGAVNKDEVHVDFEKLNLLLNKNVFYYNECKKCFAKWHCAGGCLFQRNMYSKLQFKDNCSFIRKFIQLMILEKVSEEEYKNEIYSNKSINLLSM